MWMNPHHFLTIRTWHVISVNANRMNQLWNSVRNIFESRISHGATEKFTGWEKSQAQTVAWFHDMEGHAQKSVGRYCDLTNKKVEQLYKVSSPCLGYHQFKQEEFQSVRELSKHCSQVVLKGLYLARIGQSISLRDQSQNGLKHVTNAWQRWFLTFISRTISNNIVMWWTRHSIVEWVCFRTQTLLEILNTRNQIQIVSCVVLETKLTSQSVDCAKKQTCYFAQFYRIWNQCWITCEWITCSWSLGHEHKGKFCFSFQNQDPKCRKKTFFSHWISVAHFWKQRIKMIIERTNSDDETRAQNPIKYVLADILTKTLQER